MTSTYERLTRAIATGAEIERHYARASAAHDAVVHCECGTVTGAACAWSGPVNETIVIEWMPEHLRASHEAAGYSGLWPLNGAVRLRVEESCADRIEEADPEWTEREGGQ